MWPALWRVLNNRQGLDLTLPQVIGKALSQVRGKTVDVLFQGATGQLGGKSVDAESPARRLLQLC